LHSLFHAYQVKTTQPRRYLVRPNQGLILPGLSASIQIVLVEKDKTALLASYQRLGPAALEHCKDKFLVQSCPVSEAFVQAQAAAGNPDAAYEQLTQFWSSSMSNGASNRKLHVRHVVTDSAGGDALSTATTSVIENNTNSADAASELARFRNKYDDLVQFSVQLTAERDILNNTLERMKRDVAAKQRTHAAGSGNNNVSGQHRGSNQQSRSFKSNLIKVVAAFVFFLLGVRMQVQYHVSDTLATWPIVNRMMVPEKHALVDRHEVQEEEL
jgi:hypothetical protein